MSGNTHYPSDRGRMILFIFYNMQYIIIHNLIEKSDHYFLLVEKDGIISDRAQTLLNRLYSENKD